jgi:hypothetical protein
MASAMAARNGLSPGPMALLPPVYLYRRLLRAHRKHLPSEMRLLGDEYIKSEFRAHREVENPVHLVCFVVYGGFLIYFAKNWAGGKGGWTRVFGMKEKERGKK